MYPLLSSPLVNLAIVDSLFPETGATVRQASPPLPQVFNLENYGLAKWRSEMAKYFEIRSAYHAPSRESGVRIPDHGPQRLAAAIAKRERKAARRNAARKCELRKHLLSDTGDSLPL